MESRSKDLIQDPGIPSAEAGRYRLFTARGQQAIKIFSRQMSLKYVK
jgi:hypothetical protein